jgi:hypothetical protein
MGRTERRGTIRFCDPKFGYVVVVPSAHQLSRACREPGYSPSGSSGEEPPAYLTVPTTVARCAVRTLHTSGATPAKLYLGNSKVGEWTGHSNRSMASGAEAVIDGFDWYAVQDVADGRPMKALDASTAVSLPAGSLSARLDVVLDDGSALAGRVVLWDGPDFDPAVAPVMACAFALALQALYPSRAFTTVGIWQARRQRSAEVPHAAALAQTAAASAILASM